MNLNQMREASDRGAFHTLHGRLIQLDARSSRPKGPTTTGPRDDRRGAARAVRRFERRVRSGAVQADAAEALGLTGWKARDYDPGSAIRPELISMVCHSGECIEVGRATSLFFRERDGARVDLRQVATDELIDIVFAAFRKRLVDAAPQAPEGTFP